MRVRFWGARGSLPPSVTADIVRAKIRAALERSAGRTFGSGAEIDAFMAGELPFSVAGGYGCNTSCVEVIGGHERVVCDAGTGLRDLGNGHMAAARSGGKILPLTVHILISHLHWDHIQGFPFFIPAYLPGNRITLYGCHSELKDAFVFQQTARHFPVPLDAMRADIRFERLEPGREYDIGGLKVTAMELNHPGKSYTYRLSADNRSVVYSTDAEHKADAEAEHYPFVDFVRGADVLIFDAQYSLVDHFYTKENWGHSSNLVGVELAVRAGVKRLCLFHSEPTCSDDVLDRILDHTRKYVKLHAESYPLTVDLAYDGLEVEV